MSKKYLSKNFVWVRLGRGTWWPGEEIQPSCYSDDIKDEIQKCKCKFVKVVKFFSDENNEEDEGLSGGQLIKRPGDMQPYVFGDDAEEEGPRKKTLDLIRKGAETLKDGENGVKFRSDVIEIESRLSSRSRDLTSVWFETVAKKKQAVVKENVVKQIFKKVEPEVEVVARRRPGAVVVMGMGQRGRGRGQVIGQGKVIGPAGPSGSGVKGQEKKGRYCCSDCDFSSDRLGVLTGHRKVHSGSGSMSVSGHRLGQSTPMGLTPVKQATVARGTPKVKSSPQKGQRSSSPEKPAVKRKGQVKGQRSPKKQKLNPDLNASNILADWDDEDKLGDLDDEDEDKPPTLKIFDTDDGSVAKGHPGLSGVERALPGGSEAALLGGEVESHTVAKKGIPRTDKELNAAFEELLRVTRVDSIEDRVNTVATRGGSTVATTRGGEIDKDGDEPEDKGDPEGRGIDDPPAQDNPEDKPEGDNSSPGDNPIENNIPEDKPPIESLSEDKPDIPFVVEPPGGDNIIPSAEDNPMGDNSQQQQQEEEEDFPPGEEEEDKPIEEFLPPEVNPPEDNPPPPSEDKPVEEFPTIDNPLLSDKPPSSLAGQAGKPTACIRPTASSAVVQVESDPLEKLETENVVHLVPVENPDGSVTYMLLSLGQGAGGGPGTQGAAAATQGVGTATSVRVSATTDSSENAAQLVNASEMEGIYLDGRMDAGSVFSSLIQKNPSSDSVPEEAVIYVEQPEGASGISWEAIQQVLLQQNNNQN